jgi:hypothetical protein
MSSLWVDGGWSPIVVVRVNAHTSRKEDTILLRASLGSCCTRASLISGGMMRRHLLPHKMDEDELGEK